MPSRFIFCFILISATASHAFAQDAQKPAKLPVKVMAAWEKAEKIVQKNRETYDKANEKALAGFQKDLERMNPPVEVDELVLQFQKEAIVALDENAKPPAPPLPDPGEGGVAVFKGHRYKLILEELSWEEARKRCEGLGGHLLTIEDNNENEFVVKAIEQFANQHPELPKGWHVWLGLRYDKEKDKWFSLNGQVQLFHVWILTHKTQDRAVMRQNGNWFSRDGAATEYFICEWDR